MQLAKRLTLEMLERIIADAILVNLAVMAALALRLLGMVWLQGDDTNLPASFFVHELRGSVTAYVSAAPLLTILCLVTFSLSGFYTYGRSYQSRYKALIIFQAVTLAYLVFGTMAYLFFAITTWFPRTVWLSSWLLTVGVLEAVRFWSSLWRATVLAEAKVVGHRQHRTLRNITVIGGAGYIGSILVRKLLNQGYHVTVLDALMYGDESIQELYAHPHFECIHGDLRNVESVVHSMRSADAVVHLGGLVGDPACALDERLTLEINLAATRMVAEAAKGFGVERFIFASTCSVYGASDDLLDERSALNPVSLYAQTKIDSERILQALDNDRFATVCLRFATIYGLTPRPRFDLVVNLLAAKATCEKNITIFGGDQWRPFVHVEDVADAIVLCVQAPVQLIKKQVFNVGSDSQNYRIAQLGDLITHLMPDVQVVQKTEDTDARNYRVSFAKIRHHLDFTPHCTVEDGILEIKAAIERGDLPDYRDVRYSNYRTLAEQGNMPLIRQTRITPLYADDLEVVEGLTAAAGS
jgi:nucleoside-diphosphate-sugar epimerase